MFIVSLQFTLQLCQVFTILDFLTLPNLLFPTYSLCLHVCPSVNRHTTGFCHIIMWIKRQYSRFKKKDTAELHPGNTRQAVSLLI